MKYFGSLVSIPLTTLQYVSTQIPVSVEQCVLNLAISHAVYDADRSKDDTNPGIELSTKAATYGSSLYLAQHTNTIPLIPLLLILHLYYAEMKPFIAPMKPFVIAIVWTVATFYLPTALYGDLTSVDIYSPLFIWSQITALSHLADGPDRFEDEAANLITPAVALGSQYKVYGVAWFIVSIWVHTMTSNYNDLAVVYDAISSALVLNM